jgi:hypothetical protein
MGVGFSNIPKGYDVDFISTQSGVLFDGRSEQAEHTRVTFMDSDGSNLDLVAQAVANYGVDYLTIRRPKRIAEVSKLRDEKIGGFIFNGMPIELDLETKANITGSVSGLDRNPDVTGLDWSLGDGEFVFLDRASLYALADAAFLHVQGCFTHAKTLVTDLKAAADCTALDAIDITVGWPGDTPVEA